MLAVEGPLGDTVRATYRAEAARAARQAAASDASNQSGGCLKLVRGVLLASKGAGGPLLPTAVSADATVVSADASQNAHTPVRMTEKSQSPVNGCPAAMLFWVVCQDPPHRDAGGGSSSQAFRALLRQGSQVQRSGAATQGRLGRPGSPAFTQPAEVTIEVQVRHVHKDFGCSQWICSIGTA